VKIWKNIGMEIKDRNGKFIMADDLKFDPIISVGMHAVLAFAHKHRIRTWSVATWSCRASALRGFYILDTKPDPKQPKIVKVIEPEEFIKKTGYTSPHTIHCGPDGIYGSALGSASGDGPGGIFLMDANTFELKGQWEKDRGPQQLAYDFWWHLGHDAMITSEWGTPNMVKDGINPELLLAGKYGHKIHIWDLDKRCHLRELELGAEQQMSLELRPAHSARTVLFPLFQ